MYNKTTITQLGTCLVEVEHKNDKRMCTLFVVPGNRQALLGMPDIDALNIIKTNIHTIGAEQTIGSDSCAKMCAIQRDDPKQETVRAEKCYTNTYSISKSNSKTKPIGEEKII